mgnify:CR=1 FL=1
MGKFYARLLFQGISLFLFFLFFSFFGGGGGGGGGLGVILSGFVRNLEFHTFERINMAATVLRLRGPLRLCSVQGIKSTCQVMIT